MKTFTLAMSLIAGLLVPGLASPQSGESMAEENWLPIQRRDVDRNVIVRRYNPDLGRFKTWTPPGAKKP